MSCGQDAVGGMTGFAYDLRNVSVHLSEVLYMKQMQVRESSCEIVVVGKEQTDCNFAGNLNTSSSCRQQANDLQIAGICRIEVAAGKEQTGCKLRAFE